MPVYNKGGGLGDSGGEFQTRFLPHPIRYFSRESREKRSFLRELEGLNVDEEALRQHDVSVGDLFKVRRYVLHLQEDFLSESRFGLFSFGGRKRHDLWYGAILSGRREEATRFIIHEIVEMRDLDSKGVDLLAHPPAVARELLTTQHAGSHRKALMAEYDYWRGRNPRKDVRDFTQTLNPEDVEHFTNEYTRLHKE